MGIYYQIVCDDCRERIDPGGINHLGIKAHAIAHPKHPFGQIAVFAMLRFWREARITPDHEDACVEYKDITEQVLKEYNEVYKTDFSYTGP